MGQLSVHSSSRSWFRAYKSGAYYFCNSPAASSTLATMVNGTVRVAPWIVREPVTITRIGAEFTAAGDAASVYRLVVFADDGTGYPTGTPILDPGSISTGTGDAGTVATGGTPGVYDIVLGSPATFGRGVYWVGGVLQGVTTTQPTIRIIANGSQVTPFPMSSVPATAAVQAAFAQSGVTGAIGAWTGTNLSSAAPRVHFKVA